MIMSKSSKEFWQLWLTALACIGAVIAPIGFLYSAGTMWLLDSTMYPNFRLVEQLVYAGQMSFVASVIGVAAALAKFFRGEVKDFEMDFGLPFVICGMCGGMAFIYLGHVIFNGNIFYLKGFSFRWWEVPFMYTLHTTALLIVLVATLAAWRQGKTLPNAGAV